MNVEFKELFGAEIPLIPLRDSGNVTCGNAVRFDWAGLCDPELGETFVLGNPPYAGSSTQGAEHKADFVEYFKYRCLRWPISAGIRLAVTGRRAARSGRTLRAPSGTLDGSMAQPSMNGSSLRRRTRRSRSRNHIQSRCPTSSRRTASRAWRPRLTGMAPILPPANPGRGSGLGARSDLPRARTAWSASDAGVAFPDAPDLLLVGRDGIVGQQGGGERAGGPAEL